MAKYSSQDRVALAKKGHALPDGSFPIADDEDLRSAIRNWALGKSPDVAKKFIIQRARAMNSFDVLPEKWRDQLSHTDEVEEFIQHFGVKGMHWGKSKVSSTTQARINDARADAKETLRAKNKVGKGSTSRRNAIKNSVAEKSKDPAYAKEFVNQLAKRKDFVKKRNTALSTTASVAPLVALYGVRNYNTILDSAGTARLAGMAGSRYIAKKLAGDPGKIPVAKIIKGVYKVSSVR